MMMMMIMMLMMMIMLNMMMVMMMMIIQTANEAAMQLIATSIRNQNRQINKYAEYLSIPMHCKNILG